MCHVMVGHASSRRDEGGLKEEGNPALIIFSAVSIYGRKKAKQTGVLLVFLDRRQSYPPRFGVKVLDSLGMGGENYAPYLDP